MGTKFRGIKSAAEHQRGELVKDLLKLVGAGIIGATIFAAPNTAQLLEYLDPKSRAQRNKIWNIIHYLERHGDIEVRTEKDGNDYVFLTSKGKYRLTSDSIWELSITRPRRWDRKWRIVMFDFPNNLANRREFRLKLQDLGFQLYQKSVFIYPYECREEVFTIAKWLNLHQHVRYVVASEIHDMRHFARIFDLL